MKYIKPNVATICVGMAASMGAILLAGGAEGKRTSLPNSKILIHQPWIGGLQGQTIRHRNSCKGNAQNKRYSL